MTTRGRLRIEDGAKRVRAYVDGVPIADTVHPRLVWEVPYYPTYYFPTSDVASEHLEGTETTRKSPSRGVATMFDLKVDGRLIPEAAYAYPSSPIEELRDYVAFIWEKVDHWFEEDEEVYVHARDPYTRVDILPSSRHVRVEIGGRTVADSHHPRLLFETGLPTRYYLPKPDVRMELLESSDLRSDCPYKGTAEYWSANVDGVIFENVAWAYRHPVRESERIAGLLCFYNEKVDIYVDGVRDERPSTVFS